ncbi:MAG: hypothetical protein WDZ62_02380 [Candidatus Pacearchaeota archaeon]
MEVISKSQIEKEISGKGEFIKIDYLTRFLKKSTSIDVKKFIFLKLAESHEKIGMLKDAAKNYGNAGMVSIPFSQKINYFVKEAKTYIKVGDYESADNALKKALREANSKEKNELYLSIKDFYKKQAEKYEEELKRRHAVKIYEKLLYMKLDDSEKEEIMKKLLDLYDRLNQRKEYLSLKKRL